MSDSEPQPTTQMLIGGQRVDAVGDERLPVSAPFDQSVVATVPRSTDADVDRAVRAAAEAYDGWRLTPPRERGRMMTAIGDDLVRDTEEIARLLARETGNALRTQSRPETAGSADFFHYYGGLASELKGEVTPFGPDLFYYTTREPFGVVGAIVAWNSPLMLAATKIAMSILCGNTVVLKASEDAPLAILRMAEVCQRHLPPGVINVVTGYGEEAGASLVRHPGVARITFTGSTEVGRDIATVAGQRIVPLSLELGGKSPAIVFPDSDSDAVADGVIAGMRFTRMGQGCTAGSRLFLHESIFDSFLARLSAKLEAMKIGDPLDEATDIGCIINQKQYDRVCSYLREGLEQGAKVRTGGLPAGNGSGGYAVPPTVLTDVHPDWRLVREEIFGPVLVAIPWTDEASAIAMANDSHYGLSAYVWCRDIAKAIRTAHSIETGGVQINRGSGPVPGMSDGGIKNSGYGREHSLEDAIDDFTYRKSVAVGLGG